MQRRYSRVRETAFDLYTERDAVAWYIRAIALVSSWIALAGYMIFALISTSEQSNTRISRTALTILASSFLVIGYIAIAATAFYSRSLLLLYDVVLLPILASSVMGIVVTVLNHALHKRFAATNVKIAKIKRLDKERRRHVPRWERASVNYGDVASTTELLPIDPRMSIPEDEAQRQQLLRLLVKRENARSPAMPGSASTYKITLPGEEGSSGLQVISPDARPRSGSLPNTSKWNIISKVTRERSPPVETFKDHRERRREEIERTSTYLSTPRADSPWLHPSDASFPYQSQTWTPSTRYA
ncbi:hypothetical protein LTR10_014611 [Elasticomyces elasticus]|uniref:Uncharacterized protein n=1 Tax=Exophiala sideris TaxID=1016849 RepID=A0ABR0JSN1_9EURO|nr:hypothetical protein LTR10_014611 [Elasticomyces elasticus]KAK5040588.1 hypothetical protein LTS07_001088 [Exophiala sideris]KAK5042987.1 hypothetical protein LTR13_000757 [Exophiala sideris]KAK5068966.1 hypothetical protein LTR69_001089 [Exophiala sideris]KAK5186563.1 hypothetical protein LTR44_001620 [Eurotiomycetes sp. CCFEE 6388]